jgi:hypothetical protein
VAQKVEDLPLRDFIVLLNHTIKWTGGTVDTLGNFPFWLIKDMMQGRLQSFLDYNESVGNPVPNGSEAGHHPNGNGREKTDSNESNKQDVSGRTAARVAEASQS